MKNCRTCGRAKPEAQFLAGKAKRVSADCSPCRRKKQQQHIKGYYRSLPVDKRHELTHKKRAADYGVEHVAYSRTEIFRRWRNLCGYCGAWATHMDHITPLSKGGADKESNVIPACQNCNLTKGAKTLAEWALTFGPGPDSGLDTPF